MIELCYNISMRKDKNKKRTKEDDVKRLYKGNVPITASYIVYEVSPKMREMVFNILQDENATYRSQVGLGYRYYIERGNDVLQVVVDGGLVVESWTRNNYPKTNETDYVCYEHYFCRESDKEYAAFVSLVERVNRKKDEAKRNKSLEKIKRGVEAYKKLREA